MSTTATARSPVAITTSFKTAALGCLRRIRAGGATYKKTSHSSRHETQMADELGSIFLGNQLAANHHIHRQLKGDFATTERTLPDQYVLPR